MPIGTAKRFHAWAYAHHVQDLYAPILARIGATCAVNIGKVKYASHLVNYGEGSLVSI